MSGSGAPCRDGEFQQRDVRAEQRLRDLTGTSASSNGLLRSDRALTWNLRKCPYCKQFTSESNMTKHCPDRTQVDKGWGGGLDGEDKAVPATRKLGRRRVAWGRGGI